MKSPGEISTVEKEAQSILAQLRSNSKKISKENFDDLITQFKRCIVKLPNIYQGQGQGNSRYQRLAMEGFEEAVKFYAVKEAVVLPQYFSLLRGLYFPVPCAKSDMRVEIVALELLTLLVSRKQPEFYMLLERLNNAERSKKEVEFVCNVAELLEEGNYAQVQALSKKGGNVSSLFTVPLQQLEATVTQELQSCIEAAYTALPVSSATSMLKTLPQEWEDKIAGNVLYFHSNSERSKPAMNNATAKKLISEALNYAKELERIV